MVIECPYQCVRRWFDDGDVNHLANMGKYVSAMVAAGARVTYSRKNDHLWFGIVLITSVVATVYQLYWDFVKDWGFLTPNSINPWLRDELILKNKSVYYMSIVSFPSLPPHLNFTTISFLYNKRSMLNFIRS